MAIKHIIDAAMFLNKLRNTAPPSIEPNLEYVHLQSGAAVPVHYYPARKQSKDSGWILFIHGMNYSGFEEPRIMNLCSALAECGYNVLSPNIESIANFWIDFEATSKIKEIICALKQHQGLNINKKLALMSLSLTGTVSVHASAEKKCAEHLSGILLFGSFADSHSFISHVLSNDCTQAYPKLIVIKNLLQLANKDPELVQALHYYINDMYQNIDMEQDRSESREYLEKIQKPEVKAALLEIISSLDDTEHYRVQYAKELKYIDDEFAKMDFPEELPFPITLLHGEDDNTITADESIKMHKKLQQHNSPSEVLVTPLIESHSHFKLTPKTLWEFFLLSKSMGKFLARASD